MEVVGTGYRFGDGNGIGISLVVGLTRDWLLWVFGAFGPRLAVDTSTAVRQYMSGLVVGMKIKAKDNDPVVEGIRLITGAYLPVHRAVRWMVGNSPGSRADIIYSPGSDMLTEVQLYMSTVSQQCSGVIRAFSDVEKPFLFSDLVALTIKSENKQEGLKALNRSPE